MATIDASTAGVLGHADERVEDARGATVTAGRVVTFTAFTDPASTTPTRTMIAGLIVTTLPSRRRRRLRQDARMTG